ncbi:hypothetical protein I350_03850 [Cryptococcus amylolentus CBS 6273]|uniref:Far11/STRP C-terminal domain-containing protein n=1 Tax=Cryptococcus amylolentus CBS 6273 TaxID=1296118 RepID=A0A1E3K530_9TREE|nr:hypothetical protein I350_03850 [Cryptococcus amylolentus CBS 6273]
MSGRPVFGGMFDMMRKGAAPSNEPAAEGESGQGGQAQGQQQPNPPTTGFRMGMPLQGFTNRPRAPAMIMKREGEDGLSIGLDQRPFGQQEKKAKLPQFDFRYDDTDTLMNELEEFYPYVEMSDIGTNAQTFKESFDGDWTEAKLSVRKSYIELQLEHFESPNQQIRRLAQGRLLYLLQGCFEETTSPEMQLHWVIENAKAVRAVDGVSTIVYGLRDASRRYNSSSEEKDKPSSGALPSGTVPAQVDPYDDHSAELMDLLAMLYFVVEVLRTDDTFGDELMAITPSLPLILFQMISTLRDKIPRGYPVKKVLLLLWKTLLACLGGMREVQQAMALSRESAGLDPNTKYFTKASPIDIANWRRDTSTKYPTFAPPTTSSSSFPSDYSVPHEKLAEGIRPIPPRPNYHSTELPPTLPRAYPPASQGQGEAGYAGNMMPGTPAPSPPPSPAPMVQGPGPQQKKKQQYQTDPSRPFVFPYSHTSGATPLGLVPFAISEADRLYHRHEYISLGLLQMWETREEYIREERGLGRKGLIGFTNGYDGDEEEDEEEVEAMVREWKYEQEEMECESAGDREGARKARERRMASKRLRRVDEIHRKTLPIMHSCMIALLKLLLATVTSPGAGGVNLQNSNLPPGLHSPTQEMPPTDKGTAPATQEEIDISRHREITSKAVSAIIILLLKWFKASHILKFHLLTQMLFDSNCVLLLLKMFGLTEITPVITARNEIEELNFFNYCYLNHSRNPPTNHDPAELRHDRRPSPNDPTPEGAEFSSDYSWRNFFSTINFLKVMQKVTKHRSHRTFVMSSYKSWQILKRMLKVNHPMMQLQILKLIKSQMPWCGRKWRQAAGNMKVITSIYLNCRPELRDDWLAGTDQDTELEDSMPQDNALRTLVSFYNMRLYTPPTPLSPDASSHARRQSTSHNPIFEDPVLNTSQTHFGPGQPQHRRSDSTSGQSTGSEHDVFPPRKSDSPAGAGAGGSYNPDEMIEFWLHEYEDVLGEVFGVEGGNEVLHEFGLASGMASLGIGKGDDDDDAQTPGVEDRAWSRLNEIMRGGNEEDISDSESVVSVGELGDEARMGGTGFGGNREGEEEGEEVADDGKSRVGMGQGRRRSGAGENTWEHMSPTLALLPRSPIERRRSSSGGSPLRPIVPTSPLNLDPFGHNDVFDEEEEFEVDPRGPMPIKMDTRDHEEREGGAVDEVEYTYGE